MATPWGTGLLGVYGEPPAEVAEWPEGATQFSPLIPGSQALEATAEGALTGITMVAPAGTIERRYAMGLALRTLAPGAPMIVLGLRNKGGSRLSAEMREFGCQVTESSRRHYRICFGRRPASIDNLDRALQDGAPRFVDSLGLWSQPGVFSWDRIDPGSSLLAKHIPELAGRGADIGCGIGYLAKIVLASRKIEHVTLIDVDRRALAMAQMNVEHHRTSFVWADLRRDGSGLADLDFVVMNPPFHEEGVEDRSLGQSFIRSAAESLHPGGTLWVTANRHLPYEAVLKSQFREVSLKIEEKAFKVYAASK